MNVVGKDFDADLNNCISITFSAKVLNVYKVSNIALLSLKVIALFYLKYKTELDPEHLPTSEIEIFLEQTTMLQFYVGKLLNI